MTQPTNTDCTPNKYTERNKKYYKKFPWKRHYYNSCYRAKQKGWQHTLTQKDFELLWDRDEGWKLERPSIDRIDSNKGYIQGNCRFIELSLNCKLGSLGRKNNKSQSTAGCRNLKKWIEENCQKLTETDIREIRRLSKKGLSQYKIARRFGVTQGNVWAILSGKTWKHV